MRVQMNSTEKLGEYWRIKRISRNSYTYRSATENSGAKSDILQHTNTSALANMEIGI